MPTRITVIHRVVIAVGVKVQTVYRLGIKITRIIRRDKSAPSRGVVARIEEVQPGVLVVVVAAVSDRVSDRNAIGIERNRAITPCIVGIAANLCAVRVINGDDIAKQIALEIVRARCARALESHADHATFVIEEHDLFGNAVLTVVPVRGFLADQSARLVVAVGLITAGQHSQRYGAARCSRSIGIAAANPLPKCIVAIVVGVRARKLHALGQSCKLAARPSRRVAVVGGRTAHCVVADAHAAARGQSVGIGAVIGERCCGRRTAQCTFRIGVFLDLGDASVVIILVYKGFVKLYRIRQAPPFQMRNGGTKMLYDVVCL